MLPAVPLSSVTQTVLRNGLRNPQRNLLKGKRGEWSADKTYRVGAGGGREPGAAAEGREARGFGGSRERASPAGPRSRAPGLIMIAPAVCPVRPLFALCLLCALRPLLSRCSHNARCCFKYRTVCEPARCVHDPPLLLLSSLPPQMLRDRDYFTASAAHPEPGSGSGGSGAYGTEDDPWAGASGGGAGDAMDVDGGAAAAAGAGGGAAAVGAAAAGAGGTGQPPELDPSKRWPALLRRFVAEGVAARPAAMAALGGAIVFLTVRGDG